MNRLLAHTLQNDQSHLQLLGPDGEAIDLPPSVVTMLRRVGLALAQGHMVTVVPYGPVVTPIEAASILNVSYPALLELLDNALLPTVKTEQGRRIPYADLLDYHTRVQKRFDILNKLAQLSQDAGQYERL